MKNPKVYRGFLAENDTPKVYQKANFETLNILTPLSLYPLSPPPPPPGCKVCWPESASKHPSHINIHTVPNLFYITIILDYAIHLS